MTQHPEGNDFVAISAGVCHSLALKRDGTVVGWGDNSYGQTASPDGNDFVAISAGGWHSLALKRDGSIFCWGDNDQGQATRPEGNDFVAISAGGWHSLALKRDGSIFCWGSDIFGEATPPGGNDFIAIAAGGGCLSLALKSNGSIVGWGLNWYDEATLPEGNDFNAISAGFTHSLALKKDGSVVGCGSNWWGEASPPGTTAVEQYKYDGFGQPTIKDPNGATRTTSSLGNRFMFTGREYDSETGNYYYRARYYKPNIGRFLQTDPIGYEGGLNLYTYCLNNPVNWVDPYGQNVFGGVVSWIAGNGFDTSYDMGGDEAVQLGSALGRGALDGATIAANEYTFGAINSLDKAASEKVCEYGAVGRASQIASRVSRDAAIAAAGMKMSGWNAKAGIHSPHHGQGTHLQVNWWQSGVKGSGGRWSFP